MIVRHELAQLSVATALFLPRLRFSKQMRRGGGQLDPIGHQARADSIQIVNARQVHMPHVPKKIALVVNHRYRHAAGADMPEVFHVVLLVPVGQHVEEVGGEHAAPHVVVVRLGALGFLGELAHEPQRNVGLEVVAFLFLELFEQLGSPGNEAVVIRFIAEKAEHGLAEFVPEKRLVLLMSDLYESASRFRIQVVDERVKAILDVIPVRAIAGPRRRAAVHVAHKNHGPQPIGQTRIGTFARRSPHEVAAGREWNHRRALVRSFYRKRTQRAWRQREGERLPGGDAGAEVGDDGLHTELRILGVNQPSRQTARVIALVLYPDLHAAFLRLLDRELGKSELLRREVLGFQAAPPPDVYDEHSIRQSLVQFRDDPGLGELTAIRQPADGAVLARRRLEIRSRIADWRHGNLLPRPLPHQS